MGQGVHSTTCPVSVSDGGQSVQGPDASYDTFHVPPTPYLCQGRQDRLERPVSRRDSPLPTRMLFRGGGVLGAGMGRCTVGSFHHGRSRKTDGTGTDEVWVPSLRRGSGVVGRRVGDGGTGGPGVCGRHGGRGVRSRREGQRVGHRYRGQVWSENTGPGSLDRTSSSSNIPTGRS